jgi:hypothetical protein
MATDFVTIKGTNLTLLSVGHAKVIKGSQSVETLLRPGLGSVEKSCNFYWHLGMGIQNLTVQIIRHIAEGRKRGQSSCSFPRMSLQQLPLLNDETIRLGNCISLFLAAIPV